MVLEKGAAASVQAGFVVVVCRQESSVAKEPNYVVLLVLQQTQSPSPSSSNLVSQLLHLYRYYFCNVLSCCLLLVD